MSANRSVQAAQRRRSGPTDATPGRGPQPSINSSQMFAGQPSNSSGRPGQNRGTVTQQQQQPTQQKSEGLSGVNKMTIPQAITLITLRLGSIETKLMNLEHNGLPNDLSHGIHLDGQENMVAIDNSLLQSITSRLESLEKRSAGSNGANPEVNLLKQQIETLKQIVVQSKSVTTLLTKDNRDLKTYVDNLKQELYETKDILASLQNVTMDSSKKILELSMNVSRDGSYLQEQTMDDSTVITDQNVSWEETDRNDIVGTNLKEIIENEINAEM
jgi:hypothetical protein